MGRYTDAEKRTALDHVAASGIAHAHRQTGIPKPTLSRWAADAHIDLEHSRAQTRAAVATSRENREAVREQFRTKLLDKAVDMLDRMDQEHVDFRGKNADQVTFPRPTPEGCRAYATAAAILIDKLRLELGEATARHEHGVVDARERALAAVDEVGAKRREKQAA